MLDETWHIWASANADWDQDNRVVGKARQIGENLKSVTKICQVKNLAISYFIYGRNLTGKR